MHFVHISDLHLTADDGAKRTELPFTTPTREMNEVFRRLLFQERIQTADFLVVTGDVTDLGDVESWKVFWDAIAAADIDFAKVFVVPGNHDLCPVGTKVSLGKKGSARSQAALEEGLAIGQPADLRSFPCAYTPHAEVVIFGLDSNNRESATAFDNAAGHLGMPQLDKLSRLMRKHIDRTYKFVALHHSPNIPQKDAARRNDVTHFGTFKAGFFELPESERRALRLMSTATGVDRILHGHLHDDHARKIGGIEIIGAPASTEWSQKPNTEEWGYWYRSFELRNAKVFVRDERMTPPVIAD
ncbi:MAG: 3',5'-cyclic AMP phosphodiesterase CpdA [Bradymonadia bacterium]|jgi:3',5'-cyclic AMP phosphodiesterase CpdA